MSFFFFKQKTAYELRISDWSSDVCSSDLSADRTRAPGVAGSQRRATDPAFDDRVAARPGLRVVGQPHPRAGGRARVEGGQAGIERVIVDADRQQHDGQFAHGEELGTPGTARLMR